MRILVQLEHRLLAGEAFELFEQDLQGALLLALRTEVQGRVSVAARDAEQRRDQRRRLAPAGPSPARATPPAWRAWPRHVVAREAGCALQPGDHRIERAVGVMRRAEWLSATCGSPRSCRAAPGRAATCRCPARPRSGPPGRRRPWPGPSARSGWPSSCSRPTSGVTLLPPQRLEAALGVPFAYDPERRERLGEALQASRPEVGELE